MTTRKKREKREPSSLRGVRDFDALCRLPRDNFSYGDFSIMTDSLMVWLTDQAFGEEPKQSIEIPRSVFNRLLARYCEPQRVRPRKRLAPKRAAKAPR